MIIYGYYKKTLYKDYKTGYTKFLIYSNGNVKRNYNGDTCCYGYIMDYVEYTPLKIDVELVINNKGNYEYKVNKIDITTINERISMMFIQNLCTEITQKDANNIIDIIGEDIFDFAEKNNAFFMIKNIVPKLSDHLINNFIKKIKKYKEYKDIVAFLSEFGADFNEIIKSYNLYKEKTMESLKKNPYKAFQDGTITFYTAEKIAFSENFPDYSIQRIYALIYKSVITSISNGNTYTDIDELQKNIKKLLNNSDYEFVPEKSFLIPYIKNNPWLICDERKIYLKVKYDQEIQSVNDFLRLRNSSTFLPFNNDIKELILKTNKINLGKDQYNALDILKSTGVKILIGDPGTGKTTTIKTIIKGFLYMKPNAKIELAAPTGRASQRLAEATGYPANTVHKLLELKPFQKKSDICLCKNETNPIDADLLIVDEFSMVDIELLSLLLNAIKNNTLVIFVGDENQLESVGDGNVLHDLIMSKKFETFKLKEIFRQNTSKKSNIITNGQKIIKGNSDFETGNDFKIFKTCNSSMTEKNVVEIFKTALKNNIDINDIQFITSNRKKINGTNELNKKLQEIYQKDKNNDFMYYGVNKFYVNDKVIMEHNNYDLGYFNGDIGYITKITELNVFINLGDKTISLSKHNMEDVSLAYAITVHKSQGSEYNISVIVLPEQPVLLLTRNLVNTAITRSKKMSILINEKNALDTAASNKYKVNRKTSLKLRLENLL